MLLLNSNLLKLDRPLVPPRMEGAASQKLNFVSLQIPLPQSVCAQGRIISEYPVVVWIV